MNVARNLERRLEAIVDGLAAKLFPGKVAASELANRLVREADLSIADGPAGPVAPNLYGVRIHPKDLGAEETPERLNDELAAIVDDTAIEQGWRLEGRALVEVIPDQSMARGSIDVAASVAPTDLEAWSVLEPRHRGESAPLRPNRCLIGRGDECDVRLPHAEVSRRHAVLWREATGTWVVDLDSANGTLLNGIAIEGPAQLHHSDGLTFGPAAFTFLPA